MRTYQIVPILVIVLALPASAQQSDRSLGHQIESVVSSYAENFNKQNASGIAGLYTKDGVLVNPAGPEKSVEQYAKMHSKPGSIIKI
jgi:ketosteroid isomerase-like protein